MLKRLKIIISGSPLPGKSLIAFEQKVLEKMERYTVDPEVETYNFLRINYRFEFTASDFDMSKVDQLHKQILKLTSDFLNRWKYGINVNYTERERGI